MKIRNILFLMSAICLTASCSKWFDADHIGEAINFGVSSGSKDISTRTSYKGTNEESGRELIQWDDGDEVDIYMTWDDPSCIKPDHGRYIVTYKQDDRERSFGSIRYREDSGTRLTWQGDFKGGKATEYPHTFYSFYPAGAVDEKTDINIEDGIVTFNIPPTQTGVDMMNAYMTAYAAGVTSTGDKDNLVQLHYYPRVTTLYITVKNDTDNAVGGDENNIKLTSSDGPISGSYTVQFSAPTAAEVSGDDDGTEITNTITNLQKGDTATIAFFIRPRVYASGKLSIDFNGKTQPLNKELLPNTKYNIKITVSGEEDLTIDDLTSGGVLMLIQFLVYLNNHYPALKDYFDVFDVDYNGFINTVFGDLRNKLDGTFTVAQMKQFIKEKDPNNNYKVWEVLQYIADNATELTVGGNGGVKKDITAKDFKVFKKVETITLLQNGDTEFTLSEHPTLKTFRISPDGSNGKLTITIKDCPKLTTVDFSPLNQNDEHSITIDNCKNLQTVMVNQNNSKQTIKITNCNANVNTE